MYASNNILVRASVEIKQSYFNGEIFHHAQVFTPLQHATLGGFGATSRWCPTHFPFTGDEDGSLFIELVGFPTEASNCLE